MLRLLFIAAISTTLDVTGQAVLSFGAGAQYDLIHYRTRGPSAGGYRPWIPPDLTGWGGHGVITCLTGQGEFALRCGIGLQWQHARADYSFLVEQTSSGPEAGTYSGTYNEWLTLWKFPVMASFRLSDRARFDLGLEPFLINRGHWTDTGALEPGDPSKPRSIPYDMEGTDDGTFKKGGMGLGAGLVCHVWKKASYSISYWRDLGGYQDASARIAAHHNMFQATLWVRVGGDPEASIPEAPGSW